jgi:hypothetical protein
MKAVEVIKHDMAGFWEKRATAPIDSTITTSFSCLYRSKDFDTNKGSTDWLVDEVGCSSSQPINLIVSAWLEHTGLSWLESNLQHLPTSLKSVS